MIIKNISHEWRFEADSKSCGISSQPFLKEKPIWTAVGEFMEVFEFMEKMRHIWFPKILNLNSQRCKNVRNKVATFLLVVYYWLARLPQM